MVFLNSALNRRRNRLFIRFAQPALSIYRSRKAIAFLVLVSFCLSLIPIPVRVVSTKNDGNAVPFPCQTCGCGCKTAHQCWTSCCCYTPAERVAWAASCGVEVPDYAADLYAVELTTTPKKSSSHETGAGRAKASCAHCVSKEQDAAAVTSEQSSEQSNDDVQLILLVKALKCRGKNADCTLLPWTILPPLASLSFIATDNGEADRARSCEPSVVDSEPDTPPPRFLGMGFLVMA